MISLVRKRPTQSFIHPKFRFSLLFAQIAQLVEQRTENPRVAGSIPALGTNKRSQYEVSFFIEFPSKSTKEIPINTIIYKNILK